MSGAHAASPTSAGARFGSFPAEIDRGLVRRVMRRYRHDVDFARMAEVVELELDPATPRV